MKSLFKNFNKERNKIQNECFNFYDKINMIKKIVLYKNDIWLPNNDLQLHKLNNSSCFTVLESDSYNYKYIKHQIKFDTNDISLLKSKKIILKLNTFQQKIIQNWIEAYRLMYNETLRFIKISKPALNWINLRAILKEKRDDIIKNSADDKKNQIKVHDIDYAVKLVCQEYKSAITNMKKGNIKSYRIRYWKKNKQNKILDLEKGNFLSGSIRRKVLGEVKGYYNGEKFDFSTITKDSRLIYKNGNYFLYVTEDVEKENKNNNTDIISLDPGLRTFLTGITENKVVKIEASKKIKEYIKKTEKVKNRDLPKKIKRKIEKRNNNKISNIVDETHWQTINYLTSNYSNILIGNMSTKSIISNLNKNNLSSRTKLLAEKLKFYEFRRKLEYKCYIRGVNYKKVNEKYTSKICSMCGYVKEDLRDNKIYECNKCGRNIDRDVNGSRNIYIKSIIA